MSRTHAPLAGCMLALSLMAPPSFADDDCDAPVQRWQSRDAVRQMAAQRGWQVQRLKIDDGCYEIRGKDADGREFKAKLDPETLQVVKMKRRDGEHERARDQERTRERDRDGRSPAPAAGTPTTPATPATPSPVFTPGTAPRGQID